MLSRLPRRLPSTLSIYFLLSWLCSILSSGVKPSSVFDFLASSFILAISWSVIMTFTPFKVFRCDSVVFCIFATISILSLPIYGFKSVFCQILIALAEMLASKEAVVSTEW